MRKTSVKIRHVDAAVDSTSPLAARAISLWATSRVVVLQVLTIAVFLAVWQYASGRWVPALFISTPGAVFSQSIDWIVDGTIASNGWTTVSLALIGFAIGALGGIVVGFILASSDLLSKVFSPFIVALYTIPRLALAPLFVLWFGTAAEFKVTYTMMLVFFLVFFNTFYGVREVSRELIDTVTLMGADRWTIVRTVVLPSALVWVAAGLKVSIPYALVGVVVAEILVSTSGLGYLVRVSAAQFDAAGTLSAIVFIGIVGIGLNAIVVAATKRPMAWKEYGGRA